MSKKRSTWEATFVRHFWKKRKVQKLKGEEVKYQGKVYGEIEQWQAHERGVGEKKALATKEGSTQRVKETTNQWKER